MSAHKRFNWIRVNLKRLLPCTSSCQLWAFKDSVKREQKTLGRQIISLTERRGSIITQSMTASTSVSRAKLSYILLCSIGPLRERERTGDKIVERVSGQLSGDLERPEETTSQERDVNTWIHFSVHLTGSPALLAQAERQKTVVVLLVVQTRRPTADPPSGPAAERSSSSRTIECICTGTNSDCHQSQPEREGTVSEGKWWTRAFLVFVQMTRCKVFNQVE